MGQWSLNQNKAISQSFLELCSLKFQESSRKSNMKQQAAPWKGRRVWISPQSEHGRGWQTDWVSATFQWSQPSTLPSAHAPLCTQHTHMHHPLHALPSFSLARTNILDALQVHQVYTIHLTLIKLFILSHMCTYTVHITLFYNSPNLVAATQIFTVASWFVHSAKNLCLTHKGTQCSCKRPIVSARSCHLT